MSTTPISLTCPNCGTSLEDYSGRVFEVFGCGNCGNIFNQSNQDNQDSHKVGTLSKFLNKYKYTIIPLGTVFTYESVRYTFIGYVIKHEVGEVERWIEYCLQSENKEYAFLIEYSGHTVFTIQINNTDTRLRGMKLYFGNTYFTDGFGYKIQIDVVVGAFNYNVLEDTSKRYYEYSAPPFVAIRENTDKENEYFIGKYLYRYEFKKSIGLTKVFLPLPSGPYHARPGRFDWNGKFVMLGYVFLSIALFLVHLISFGFQSDYYIDSYAAPQQPAESEFRSFTLTSEHSLLRVDAYSNVVQAWTEGEITLVNHTTGEQRTGVVACEYYTGFDEDGAWIEDNSHSELYFENVPKGVYHIEAQTYCDSTSAPLMLSVWASRSHWRNVVVSIIVCLAAIGLIYYIAFYQPPISYNENNDD
ncbi:MAG: DUF4178 domain-containing protein [Candidatus Kapabacteria bacterium]|nr:DUF4178 domain-containing protein [Candidatus Kapabacteria bacterium]